MYYERFVEAPWNVTEALAFSLGLPVVNRRVETFEWLAADDRHQSAWVTELERSAPSSSEEGKFRKRLRGHEMARIEWTCRDAMAAFGYAGSGKAEKWKKLMRLARNRGV